MRYHCQQLSWNIVRLFLVLSLLSGFVYADGTLVEITMFSEALNADRAVQIYLPDNYDRPDSLRFPVVYFLHGAEGDHQSYWGMNLLLDSLISNNIIEPIIMVKPDGSTTPYAGSMWSNSQLYGEFETFVTTDLISYIDTHYRTDDRAAKRGIMGHSMGAYGAMRNGLKHHDRFAAIVSHSGPLDLNQTHQWIPAIQFENGGEPPYYYQPQSGVFTYLAFTAAGAFSPNLDNPPYYVDFPMDSAGYLIDSVFSRWLTNNPSRLARNYVNPADAPPLYFDCGLQDELFFLEFNRAFADSLDALQLEYTYQEYTGTHSNRLSVRFPKSLTFLDSVFRQTDTRVVSELRDLPYIFTLSQNYPNPFNGQTTIPFVLEQPAEISLEIIDISGQTIVTLIDGKVESGGHAIEWHATGVPSGTYFYRLKSRGNSVTRKFTVVK